MTDAGNPPDDGPNQAELAYRQALQYGKDLARVYVAERSRREKLEIANQTLNAIFSSTPDGLVVLDNAFIIQQANTAFAHLVEWGTHLDSIVGQPIDSILLSDHLIPALQQLATDEGAPSQVEITVTKPVRRSLLAKIARLEAGQARGWVITLHDQSRIKRLEQQKNEFIDIAAHELRTPLASILGYAELLLKNRDHFFDPEREREFIELIIKGGNRLRIIVDEIIAFAELNQGNLQAKGVAEFRMRSLFEDLAHELQPYAEKKQVRLQIERPDAALRMHADAATLRTALYQLMLNGINYNRPGGFVRVEAAPQDDNVVIRVIDSGIGISQADLDTIFQPFFQVEPHETRGQGGLGLGLSIVRRAVSQLGGSINVESVLGSGTTLTLQLPLRQPSPSSELETLREQLATRHQQSLAYAHDIQVLYRQLQETNRELQHLNKQLEEANKLKSNFLGIVSHELRSPFVSIDLALQAFPRYGTEHLVPDQRELLEQITRSFGETRQRIDRLVNHAALLSKQGRLNLDRVNITELIEETVAALRPMAEGKRLELRAEVPPNLILPTGDQERIGEAIWHLLHNAIKFTPAGGQVTARARGEADFVLIEVQDTGIGVSPEAQARIWESFSQEADPLKRGVEGLGLGLELVRYVAVAHGGNVALESEPGVGSVFGFWLPLNTPSQPGAEEHPT